jgi:hypothetical protein
MRDYLEDPQINSVLKHAATTGICREILNTIRGLKDYYDLMDDEIINILQALVVKLREAGETEEAE